MAVLAVNKPGLAGAALGSTSAGVAGDSFPNDGDVVLHVYNGSGSNVTVTIATPATPKSLGIAPVTRVVGASNIVIFGPFPPAVFNNSNGEVNVTYSAVTSVTVAAIGM